MKRSFQKNPPLLINYRTFNNAFAKTYGTSVPFVLLIQIGNFLETYDDSAQTLCDRLGMKLSYKKGVKSAGFPICSQETHTLALATHGFSVIKIIQTESADTKKQRTGPDSSSKNTNRVAIPGQTLTFVSDQPLGILQGNCLLIYFSETNRYRTYEIQSMDELLCKLMEFEPCELILRDDASITKSVRHILPEIVLRQYFSMRFTALQTLQSYLKLISQTDALETLQEKSESIVPKVSLDARTVLNLTLFGSNNSLADSISPTMTKEANTVLKTILYNPLADEPAIIERQDQIRQLMNNNYLDIFYSTIPKKNSCASLKHPLFKTNPAQFVTTEANVSKFLELILKTVVEIELWEQWVESLRRGGVDIHLEFPNVPPAISLESSTADDPIQEELRRFNAEHAFEARVVPNGFHKHLFETEIENEGILRGMRELRVHSKSKSAKVVRFDSNEIQRARLQCSDNTARRSIRLAQRVKQFLEQFQETFSPLLFTAISEIECYVALAYFFKHTAQTTVWPTFGDSVYVQQMEPPVKMTGIANWVKNNSTEQFMILKGSNGSGKTSYMRTLALNSLLAHCGLPVFAEQFQTTILDRLFMRIGSSDCLATGKSSFVVEMEHMQAIAATMTAKSALFIDELGCSCDAESGKKICEYFIRKIRETGCFCVFATHFDLTVDTVKEMGMRDGEYTYAIQDYGRNASNKNAIAVAERCGFPSSVLYFAQRLLQ